MADSPSRKPVQLKLSPKSSSPARSGPGAGFGLRRPPAAGGHGPGCGHDHSHDHGAGHDAHKHGAECGHAPGSGHDHSHDHGAGHDVHGHDAHGHDAHGHDAHGHDAHGHDAHGHDHDHGHAHSHDHGHAHAHDHGPRAPTFRPTPDGRPAMQLRLDDVLPGETDEEGRFAELRRTLRRTRGITEVMLRMDTDERELCVRFDPAVTTAEALLPEVQRIANEVARQFRMKTWFLVGMDSAQCAMVIEHALGRMEGVLQANVAYAAERLVVEYDVELTSERAIETRVEALGYTLEEPAAGHACSMHAHGGGLSPRNAALLVALSGVGIAVGVGLEWAGLATSSQLMPLYALALVAGGFQAARGALLALRNGTPDIESLMVLAAVGAAILGAWFEGAFLLFLFSLGHALEHRATDRARTAIESLARLRPDTAYVKKGEELEQVPASEVRIGDRIVVRPGDRIPLDGVIHAGRTSVDQAAVTGESIPVPRAESDPVYAGTINQEGAIEVVVSRTADSSAIARLVDMVSAAEARKGPTQRFAIRVEKLFVPIVIVGAPLFSAGLWLSGTSLRDAVLRGVSLLVAASPCALAISTPAAVLSAVARAAREGVLIKGGTHLDALGRLRTIAFDKTGTLTRGVPELQGLAPVAGVDAGTLLATAAAAEALSAHPLARAVVEAAKERAIALEPASDCTAFHGRGLRARVAGTPVWLGNEALFTDGDDPGRPALTEEVRTLVAREQQAGRTAMIVARGDRLLGVLSVADALRPEAGTTVQALYNTRIRRIVMLSGDQEIVAKAVAVQAGIDEIRAPLFPEQKLQAIRELARGGGVAMVGDGVNDAPALATATVGISLGGVGSDVALETADVVLMGDNLTRLPFALELAQASRRTIRQNLSIALGVSALLIVASLFGWVRIAQAVVLHEGSTLVVVFNGLRLLRWKNTVSS